MLRYLKNHWFGRQSLKHTLVINGLLPLSALLAVQHYILEPLVLSRSSLRMPLLITMAVLYLAVIIMAAVSVNRKSRIQDSLTYSASFHVMACNTLTFMPM